MYFDDPSEIELVADPLVEDVETSWGAGIRTGRHDGRTGAQELWTNIHHQAGGRLRADLRLQARLDLAKVDPAFWLA